MENNILQNKYLKFGLINKNAIKNTEDYEQSKILQFININNSFCLDFYDENLLNDKNIKDITKIIIKNIIKDIISDFENDVVEETINNLVDEDCSIYKFPSNTPQFYFMNNKTSIEVHFNFNKKWNSFNLNISLNEDCFFFFEITGLNNKIRLKNIHQDNYLETGINNTCDFYDNNR